ncbi:MAG: LacI family DNA-binding transcriptional regulator [Verrucomicrobiota bacterium]
MARARIQDVARLAGVASSTVSEILNNSEHSWASAETKSRVLRCAQELNYKANSIARALNTGKFNTVGLIVSDFLNPYFTLFCRLMGEELREHGYAMLIEETYKKIESSTFKTFQKMLDRHVDGIIGFAYSESPEMNALFQELHKTHRPVVLIDSNQTNPFFDSIDVDTRPGLIEAVNYLVKLGHQKIAFVGGDKNAPIRNSRMECFANALQIHELQPFPELEIEPAANWMEVRNCFGKYLSQTRSEERPTAMIAFNDMWAIGMMRACFDYHVSIPSQLSIVGMDDISVSEILPVSLTTIRAPYAEITKKAVECFLKRIGTKNWDPSSTYSCSSHLVIRESTGPARSY